ncbi:hypothetical protein D3C84_491000 [compost metagenome]
MAAVEGVGWVMEDGAVVKQELGDPLFVESTTAYYWKIFSPPYAEYRTPQAACSAYDASHAGNYILSATSSTSYKCIREGTASEGTNIQLQGVITCPTGSSYDSVKGACYKPNLIGTAPVTDADLGALDPYLQGQGAEWLKGLLREVCEGSVNPQACYDELQKQAPPSISGPIAVAGPSSTTTGTYTRPDGSTGTTSSTSNTTYNIAYGDQHYDVTTTTTTTNTKDGLQTSEETTTDSGTPEEAPTEEQPPEEEYTFTDSDLPAVEPFYEQQYPDGLEGVWDNARAQLEDSAFLSFLRSFVPSFSGTCPGFVMPLNIESWANYGNREIPGVCYALDFVKGLVLFGAVMLARRLTFGG